MFCRWQNQYILDKNSIAKWDEKCWSRGKNTFIAESERLMVPLNFSGTVFVDNLFFVLCRLSFSPFSDEQSICTVKQMPISIPIWNIYRGTPSPNRQFYIGWDVIRWHAIKLIEKSFRLSFFCSCVLGNLIIDFTESKLNAELCNIVISTLLIPKYLFVWFSIP